MSVPVEQAMRAEASRLAVTSVVGYLLEQLGDGLTALTAGVSDAGRVVARVRAAATPRRVLHRLGMLPDPFAWSPWQLAGRGRFDDPEREFHVLSCGGAERGLFRRDVGAVPPVAGGSCPSLGYARRSRANSGASWWCGRGLRS